jgi:hypothetical protein
MKLLISQIKKQLSLRNLIIVVLVLLGSSFIAGGFAIRHDEDPDKQLFREIEVEMAKTPNQAPKTEPVQKEPALSDTNKPLSENKDINREQASLSEANSDFSKEELKLSNGIPKLFNPTTPVFHLNMKAWRVHVQKMLPKLSKISSKKGAIYTMSYSDEQGIRQMKISHRGIKRLKGNQQSEFGKLNLDDVFYLQFLAASHGEDYVLIDGYMGKQTIKALKKLMQSKYQVDKEELKSYEELLKGYKE